MSTETLPIKTRILVILGGGVIYVPTVVGGTWLSYDTLMYYMSYPDSFIFSFTTAFFMSMPFTLGPILYLAGYSGLKGRKAPLSHQKKAIWFMLLGCVFGVLFMLAFDYYFLSALDFNGYDKCQGVPTGYIPGMGKQYVTDLALCK